jgi:ElaB/YqjD/DUF883 family membrane-anchored ribosome-binding protein
MKNQIETAPTLKEVLHELHGLVAEAESMMTNSLTENSPETFTSLRTRFDAAKGRFTDAYAGARNKVIAGAKCTDEAIRANPYQSLAIAAGVGLLVGALVGTLVANRRA